MVKLPNLFGGDTIYMTQSPHGQYQEFKSIDTTPLDIICPFDGCKTSNIMGTGQGSYFNIFLPENSGYIQCVHGIPTRVNSEFKKGEVMGTTVPYDRGDHWHMAINVRGKWDVILNYWDRSNKIELIGNFQSQHWAVWDTWKDKYLEIENTSIEPTPSEFDKELQNAKEWNDLVSEKYGFKIMNQIDTGVMTREQILVTFNRFKDYLQKSDKV